MLTSCFFYLLFVIAQSIYYSYSGNYILIDEPLLSFHEAQTYCGTHFATTLATIHSQSQNNEALHLCSQSSKSQSCAMSTVCWIGGQNIYHDTFTDDVQITPEWTDGSIMNYTNFYKSYTDPSQFNDKCIRMNTANGWHAVDCNHCPIRFLCNNDDKTIKGETPSPTSPPFQASTIQYTKHCDTTQSLECTQTIQNGTQYTIAFVDFIFGTDRPSQCRNPSLSISVEDIDVAASVQIYVDGSYKNTCLGNTSLISAIEPRCDGYMQCMRDDMISRRAISDVEVILILSKSNSSNQYDCDNNSFIIDITLRCQRPLFTTLFPTSSPRQIPIKTRTKTNTIHNQDANRLSSNIGTYSILFNEDKSKPSLNTVYRYNAIFVFDKTCNGQILKMDAKGANNHVHIGNITWTTDNDDLTSLNKEQVLPLNCDTAVNVFTWDTSDINEFHTIRISADMTLNSVVESNGYNELECPYFIRVNVTVQCTEIDTNSSLIKSNETGYVYIICIFGSLMLCAVCIFKLKKQDHVSADAVRPNNHVVEMEMNVLQREGERDQVEGKSVSANKKYKIIKKRNNVKQSEGRHQQYVGLPVQSLSYDNENNEAPKAFSTPKAHA
eukprot:804294_1